MDMYSISELPSAGTLESSDLLVVSLKTSGGGYVTKSASIEALGSSLGSSSMPVLDNASNPAVYTVGPYYFASDFWPDYKTSPGVDLDRYAARPLLSSWVSYDTSTKTYTFDPKKNCVVVCADKLDSLSVANSNGQCLKIKGILGNRFILGADLKIMVQDDLSPFNTPGWNAMTGLRHSSITGYVRKSLHSSKIILYPTLPHIPGPYDNFKRFKISSPLDFLREDLADLNGSSKKISDYFDYVDGAWMDGKVIEDKKCKKISSSSSGDINARLGAAMLSCMPLDGTAPAFDKDFYHHFSSKDALKAALDSIGSQAVSGMGIRLRPKLDKIEASTLYVKTMQNCWAVLGGPGQFTVRSSSGETSKHAGMFSTVQAFLGGDSSLVQQPEKVCTGRFEEVLIGQSLLTTLAFKWMAAETSETLTSSSVMPGVCVGHEGASFFLSCFPEIEVILVDKS